MVGVYDVMAQTLSKGGFRLLASREQLKVGQSEEKERLILIWFFSDKLGLDVSVVVFFFLCYATSLTVPRDCSSSGQSQKEMEAEHKDNDEIQSYISRCFKKKPLKKMPLENINILTRALE